jgi:hypothetical protein
LYGPKGIDGRLANFRYKIAEQFEVMPPGVTQIWQWNMLYFTVIDTKCNFKRDHYNVLDVTNPRPFDVFVEDDRALLNTTDDYCLVLRQAYNVTGFGNPRVPLAPGMFVAKYDDTFGQNLVTAMTQPIKGWTDTYLWYDLSQCCCSLMPYVRALLNQYPVFLPKGEILITPVGTFASFSFAR